MWSINIYWNIWKRDKHRELVPPLRKRRVQNRFTAVECAASVAALSLLSCAPDGAYPMLPDAYRCINTGELKLNMRWNDIESKIGGESGA